MGRTHPPKWETIRKNVFLRDKYMCRKCGRDYALEAHHIQAVADGGSHELSNLITLCVICHRDRETLEMYIEIPLDEWLDIPSYPLLLRLYTSKLVDNNLGYMQKCIKLEHDMYKTGELRHK